MNWIKVGKLAVPLSIYFFLAMAWLNGPGFWQVLNPAYIGVSDALAGSQHLLGQELYLQAVLLSRFFCFSSAFLVLLLPVLALTRHPPQVAALACLANVPVTVITLAWPLGFRMVGENYVEQAAAIFAVVALAYVSHRLEPLVHRVVANNSSKPTPLRGAA